MARKANIESEPISISRCTVEHASIIAILGAQTFWQSHGHSAPKKDIESYVRKAFDLETIIGELANPQCRFYLLSISGAYLGYSKLSLNTSTQNTSEPTACKLDRLYIDKSVYDQGLGKHLFEHAIRQSIAENQTGIWLYVWTKNERAVQFYRRQGFEQIGLFDFKISETHSNPNFQLYRSLD